MSLDGDLVSRIFIRGELNRMGRAGLLSHTVKLLQHIDPVSQLVEVILEKPDHTEARGSNSICSSSDSLMCFQHYSLLKTSNSSKSFNDMVYEKVIFYISGAIVKENIFLVFLTYEKEDSLRH